MSGVLLYAQDKFLLRSGFCICVGSAVGGKHDGLKRREGKITAPDKVWLRKTLERRVQLDDAWGKPDPAARRQAELAKLPKPPEKLRATGQNHWHHAG